MIRPNEVNKDNVAKFIEEMPEEVWNKADKGLELKLADLLSIAKDDTDFALDVIKPRVPFFERLPHYSGAVNNNPGDNEGGASKGGNTTKNAPKGKTKSSGKTKSKRTLSEDEKKERRAKTAAEKKAKKERDDLKNAKAEWKETERTSSPDVAKKLIIRYANMHKVRITPTTKKRAIKLLADLQRAIFNKQIRKQSPYADIVRKMQGNLLLIIEGENDGKIIDIADFDKIKRLGIRSEVKNAHAGVVMRRFIKVAGNKLSREDALTLINELKEQNDAHCDTAAEKLQEYIDGKRQYPAYEHELEGIYYDDCY